LGVHAACYVNDMNSSPKREGTTGTATIGGARDWVGRLQDSRRSLRWQVYAFAAVSLLFLWAATGYSLRERYLEGEALAAVQQDAETQLFAEGVRAALLRMDTLLFSLRSRWQGDAAAFDVVVREHQPLLAGIAIQLGVIDSKGQTAYSSLGRLAALPFLGDREHFLVQRDSADDRLFVSRPVQGRASGKLAIQLTRKIEREGRFAGALMLSLEPVYLARIGMQGQASDGIVHAVVRDTGEVMAHSQDPAGMVGRKVADGPFLRTGAPLAGRFAHASPVDGVMRNTAYVRLPEFGVSALVSKDANMAWRRARADQLATLIVTLLASALLLGAAWLMLRTIRSREQALEGAHASADRFSKLFFASPTPSGLLDPSTGKYLAINPACEALMGYPASEVIGKTPVELDVYERPAERDAMLAQLYKEGKLERYRCILRKRDGTVFPADQTVTILASEEGEFVLVALTDASDEVALAQSEERFAKMFDASPTAYVLTNMETGAYVALNPAFAHLIGYERQEALGRTATELGIYANPEDRAQMMQTLRAAPEKRAETVTMLRHSSGSLTPIRQIAMRVEVNGVAHILGALTDVSQERALTESEARFRSLISMSVDWYWEQDDQFRFTAMEGGSFGQRGLDRSEYIGKTRWELGGDDLSPAEWGQHRKVLEARLPFRDFSVVTRASDGSIQAAALISGEPRFDSEGRFLGYRGVGADITEEKRLEQVLQRREQELRLILDNVPAMVSLLDGEARYRFVNAAYTRFTGLTFERVAGKRLDEVIKPANYAGMADGIKLALQGTGGSYERVSIDAGGRERTVVRQMIPQQDAGGKVSGVIVFMRDITEEAQLQERLRQSQKMEAIGTLAGGVAHDFNNILGTILGNAELARQDLDEGDPAAVSLAEIRKASLRARDVVQQILAFSRETPVEKRALRLQEALADDVQLLRAAIPVNVEIRTRFAPDVPPILADPTQMHQVLLNLCTNAAQAMGGASGVIDVSIAAEVVSSEPHPAGLAPGRYVLLTVSDPGRGIDETTLKRIFDPFFTTKATGEGTGLGLSVVHGIVAAHGGTIDVVSQPGQGSSFRLYFPAFADAEPKPAAIPQPAPAGSGQHVIYLDDEAALVFLMERLLRRQGYRVTAVTSSAAALEAIESAGGAVDLVVTDQNMPGISGVEFASAVRARWPAVPVVLASGLVTDELRLRAAEAGVREVIYKPNTVDEMCQAISRVLAAKA